MKKCIVCDNFAVRNTEFCSECGILYQGMEEEQWFKDLAIMMKKQRYIDDMERFSLHNVDNGRKVRARRTKTGRPQVPLIVKELILSIYRGDTVLSLREIERICKNSGVSVSIGTIRKILLEYKE